MTTTVADIAIDTDKIRIADLPLLLKAARGELDGEALVALCERVVPGAQELPIRYFPVIMQAINNAIQPRPN